MIPKFRVWDMVKKAMGKVEAIVYTEERVYTFYSEIVRRYIPFAEAILMQYTGVKDRNGLEICEGDIVSWTDSNGILYFCVVEFVNGMFVVKGDIPVNEDMEIIENIYEPHDLSKVENDTV